MSAVAAVVIVAMLGYVIWRVVSTGRNLRRDREVRTITLAVCDVRSAAESETVTASRAERCGGFQLLLA